MAIQLRRGTASQWTSANPVLTSGEAGYETDTGKLKIGNSSTAWVSLAYFAGSLSDLVGDTTPQLGGNLDLNGHLVGTASAADLTKLHNTGTLSGNNTGDQDLSGYATTSALTSGLSTKQASLGFTAENVANKGVANGYASLDSAGKVPAGQMLSSVVEYKGVWDATANSPTLVDGTGNLGDEYRVGTAGTRNLGSGSVSYSVGDFVIYNGTIWQKAGGGGGGAFDLVTDTTPQLGGNLDLNTFTVGVATAADLTKLHNTGTLSGNNTGDKTLVNETTPTLGGNLNLSTFTVGAATAADLIKLHGTGTLMGNNTGDQDLSGYATTSGTRVSPIASSATPSINVDLCDQADIVSLVHNITGFTFTGTWKHGQTLMIVLKSATAQTVAGGTSIMNGPAAMPTTTVAGKYHEILLKYNSAVGKAIVMAADPTGYAVTGSPPPPTGTLLVPSNWSARGANLAFNFNYGPGAAECGQWVTFPYNDWIRPQIDDAAANGVNCLRIWGTPEAVCDGHMTLSAYLANWDTVINYCNTKGIRVYACGGDLARWSSAGDTAVISLFDSWAAMLATHSNVIGVDLCNEAWAKCVDGVTTESVALALLGQLKTKVNSHGLPASSSNGVTYQGGGWTLDTYGGASKWKFYNISDFIDIHVYYPWPYQRTSGTPNGDYMTDMYASSTLGPQVAGKQVFFGEYGTLPTGTYFSTIYPGVKALIEAGGTNHLGGCAWAMWDYSSSVDFYWGMYAVSGFPTGPTYTRTARATLAQNNTIRVTR